LYNILIEFGVPMKLVRLIKMCLNVTYSKVRIGKHLSDSFPIQNGLKQGEALSLLSLSLLCLDFMSQISIGLDLRFHFITFWSRFIIPINVKLHQLNVLNTEVCNIMTCRQEIVI
jgi:hypothetical protein